MKPGQKIVYIDEKSNTFPATFVKPINGAAKILLEVNGKEIEAEIITSKRTKKCYDPRPATVLDVFKHSESKDSS